MAYTTLETSAAEEQCTVKGTHWVKNMVKFWLNYAYWAKDSTPTWTGAQSITITTSAATALTGLTTTITCGLAHTGNVAGIRSYVTTDNTGDNIVNMFALMSRASLINVGDSISGTLTGLLCQIDLGASLYGSTGSAWGLCIDHNDTSSNRAKRPVAFMRFVDKGYAGNAPTLYVFDFGGTGNEFPSGTGKLSYHSTLWCRINGADGWIPLSTAEGTLTFAYPFAFTTTHGAVTGTEIGNTVTSTATFSSSDIFTGVKFLLTASGASGAWGKGIESVLAVDGAAVFVGFSTAGSFELKNTGDIPNMHTSAVIDLRDNDSHTGAGGAQPDAAYIRVRQAGSLNSVNGRRAFINFYSELAASTYNSDRMLVTTTAQTQTHCIRCYVSGNVLYLMATTNAPSN